MLKYLAVGIFAIVVVSAQTWVSRANLKGGISYWHHVMQEMIYEVERRGFYNMKLNDITQTLDDNLYNIHVNGTVRYTNGFVVSIQKIDITNIRTDVVSRIVDNETVIFGTAEGRLNFRDLVVGHDVYADLVNPEGEYKATGTFRHTLVQIQLNLNRNLLAKESTVSSSILSTSFGSGNRMHYMPASNITEALSRRFWHSTFESARNWANNIFAPIIVDLVDNKLEFPNVCFSNC